MVCPERQRSAAAEGGAAAEDLPQAGRPKFTEVLFHGKIPTDAHAGSHASPNARFHAEHDA
ncbi:hypothetical protein KNP414_00989 [Paenibacillus mucilaginosus KNP414]|uniref:Uncharacterized protein n=1 Tax=Paenibacillus mucilaginosus (strain KNP414) TaxID=1036673 RepID=F8FAC6_PAEMK|nr:hypothetical protein KNP414_00989 [Paenibacillus mucilaginosus KNP414]